MSNASDYSRPHPDGSKPSLFRDPEIDRKMRQVHQYMNVIRPGHRLDATEPENLRGNHVRSKRNSKDHISCEQPETPSSEPKRHASMHLPLQGQSTQRIIIDTSDSADDSPSFTYIKPRKPDKSPPRDTKKTPAKSEGDENTDAQLDYQPLRRLDMLGSVFGNDASALKEHPLQSSDVIKAHAAYHWPCSCHSSRSSLIWPSVDEVNV